MAMILLTLGLSLPLERYIDWLAWTPLWVADVFWRASFFAGEPWKDPIADASAGASSKAALDHRSDAAQTTVPLDEPNGGGVLLQQLSRLRDRDGVMRPVDSRPLVVPLEIRGSSTKDRSTSTPESIHQAHEIPMSPGGRRYFDAAITAAPANAFALSSWDPGR